MLPSATGLRLGCWLLVIHLANDFPSKSKIQPSLFSFGVSSLSTARAEETAAPRAISIHPSLVLISDYPAESNDPSSVWRVDDDGKLPPEDFHVLFVIEGRSETFMAIGWDGEEGQNINLLRSMGGEAFTGVAGAYRYWLSR